jgi:hypothetical protein
MAGDYDAGVGLKGKAGGLATGQCEEPASEGQRYRRKGGAGVFHREKEWECSFCLRWRGLET